jgi:hypothetical protein
LQILLKLRAQVHGAISVKSKTQQIHEVLSAGDQIGALRIAACFFDRSSATKTYRRGIDFGFMTDYPCPCLPNHHLCGQFSGHGFIRKHINEWRTLLRLHCEPAANRASPRPNQ